MYIQDKSFNSYFLEHAEKNTFIGGALLNRYSTPIEKIASISLVIIGYMYSAGILAAWDIGATIYSVLLADVDRKVNEAKESSYDSLIRTVSVSGLVLGAAAATAAAVNLYPEEFASGVEELKTARDFVMTGLTTVLDESLEPICVPYV